MNMTLNPARTRNFQPMTDDELRKVAPSVFTDHASPRMSDRYGFIPTSEVVTALRGEGFQPVFAGVTRSRKSEAFDRTPYARHLIRFRQEGAVALHDGFPELVLRNDHGGAGAYELFSGFFRVVCLNGLVACSGSLGSIRVRHSVRAVAGVVDGAWQVARNVDALAGEIDTFRSIMLTASDAVDFARRALRIRYDEGTAPVDPRALLQVRRYDDRPSDLWSVFNRVQENLTGKVSPSLGFVPPMTDKGRPRRMRAVTGVHESVRVNRDLWALASEFVPGRSPAASAVVEI